MRYSILGGTVEQVQAVGGLDIKEAKSTGIVFATLIDTQVAKLEELGCTVNAVGKVQTDVVPPTPVAGTPTYTPYQLSAAAGYEELRGLMVPPLYGAGFSLAIVDTGIRETHELVGGRVVYSKNYTAAPMQDGFSHGTAVCGIAVAIAPEANILNLKVMDDGGNGSEEEVVLAIDDCITMYEEKSEFAPHVINLSLGSLDDGNPNNVLRIACRAALEKGIWVFSAVGNDGPNPGTILNPACEQYVGAVGSVGYEPFEVSKFSSRGPTVQGLVKPDTTLFGENIIMASSSSDTATEAKGGTSFSCAFASGMAVLCREGQYRQIALTIPIPELTWEQAWSMTMETLLDKYGRLICVKPEGVAMDKDNELGWGVPWGPLIAQALRPSIAIGISTLIPMFMVMGMVSVMVKTVGKKPQMKGRR